MTDKGYPVEWAIRAAFDPSGGLALHDWRPRPDGGTAHLESSLGTFVVELRADRGEGLINMKTTLRPHVDLKIPFWPRDLLAVSAAGSDRCEGEVHFTQRGARGGMVLTTALEGGTALYLQDLTSLNPYCQVTGATLADTVGGDWPDLGFSLPGGDHALAEGKPITISDLYLAVAPPAEDELSLGTTFLQLLSRIYLQIRKSPSHYRDWPRAAQNALADLGREDCWLQINGQKYLRAYVGDEKTPPESMVQLAVLAPMQEYAAWRRRRIGITEDLQSGLVAFFDKKAQTIGRWHPDRIDLLDGSEPHRHPRVMDSWYLYHPLLNLSRLALKGDHQARDLFLRSLPYAIEVAGHFRYRWPVFYDLDTLEVLRAESKPGLGGENDVAGFHALVMLQAWKLTGDEEFLAEAKTAAESLSGLGFNLGYQMNTTVFAAGALLELYSETGELRFLKLSELALANVFTNVFLWECEYGNAAHYPTFMGLFPLAEAPYTAAYEEVEAIGALDRYLRDAGDDLPPHLEILLPEMIRYLLNRGIFYFPTELPGEIISEQPRTGSINRQLWLPLEDLYESDQKKAGQVGQQIYGAGSAFGILARHYWPVRQWGLMIFCEYPIDDFAAVHTAAGFKVLGNDFFDCELRLVPLDDHPVPIAIVETAAGDQLRGEITSEGHRRFVVQAGQRLQVRIDPDSLSEIGDG
ncbi:MAG TPA: hypothetical protein VJ935_09190 [Acidimicrobiia bacterium]|nr:hypothetical protein [Acidimicrobiia bacterium]